MLPRMFVNLIVGLLMTTQKPRMHINVLRAQEKGMGCSNLYHTKALQN